MFSSHFGIHPWDIDRLTYREAQTYLDALKKTADEQTGRR